MEFQDLENFSDYDTVEVYESHSHKIYRGFLYLYVINKQNEESWNKISRVQLLLNGSTSSEMRFKIVSKFYYDTIEIRPTRMVLFEKNIIQKHYDKGQEIIKHLKEQ